MSFLRPVPCRLDYCRFVESVKIKTCGFLSFIALLQGCFGEPGFVAFPCRVHYQFIDIFKESLWGFDRDYY